MQCRFAAGVGNFFRAVVMPAAVQPSAVAAIVGIGCCYVPPTPSSAGSCGGRIPSGIANVPSSGDDDHDDGDGDDSGSGWSIALAALAAASVFAVLFAGCADDDEEADGGVLNSDAESDATVADAAVDHTMRDTEAPYGCGDDDDEQFDGPSYTVGKVQYTDDHGDLITLVDVCKTPNLLVEYSCAKFHGPETSSLELASYIFCSCHEGACAAPPIDVCHNPQPDQPVAGATIWNWHAGDVLVDFCADATHVQHITCDDGVERQDVTPCAKEVPCVDGLCGGIRCVDSDPSNNPFSAGAVWLYHSVPPYYNDLSYYHASDECSAETETVIQYQCPIINDPTVKVDTTAYAMAIEKTAKPLSCPEHTVCRDGACGPDEKEPPPPVCDADSDTDPANNLYVRGSVDVLDPVLEAIVVATLEDSCSVGPTTYLSDGTIEQEWKVSQVSCSQGTLKFDSSICPGAEYCFNGVCSAEPLVCEDYDETSSGSGAVLLSRQSGEPVLGGWWFDDACIDSATVRNFFCDGSTPKFELLACTAGEICVNGGCHACFDDDEENAIEKQGFASAADGVIQSDYCVGNSLRQVECTPYGTINITPPIPCPAGTTCAAGACQ